MIGLTFSSWSGVSCKRARQRSIAKAVPGGGSLRRAISYFIARIVRKPPVTAPETKIATSVKTTFHRPTQSMGPKNKEGALKAIFFDAVATLYYLTKPVPEDYALVGSQQALTLDAHALDRAPYTPRK